MVRVVGVFRCTSAARFHSGIVRPVESAVKPSRRITKARRHGLRNLRTLALLQEDLHGDSAAVSKSSQIGEL